MPQATNWQDLKTVDDIMAHPIIAEIIRGIEHKVGVIVAQGGPFKPMIRINYYTIFQRFHKGNGRAATQIWNQLTSEQKEPWDQVATKLTKLRQDMLVAYRSSERTPL